MVQPQDRCFYKPCFGSWELAEYAREQNFEQVELCGLVSNICVLSNAALLKAALPEAEILVDAKATASFDESMNEKVLDILSGIQVKVINRQGNVSFANRVEKENRYLICVDKKIIIEDFKK